MSRVCGASFTKARSGELIDEQALEQELAAFTETVGGEMQALVNRITEAKNRIASLTSEIEDKARKRRSEIGELASLKAQLSQLASEA
jgi:hypothetical protein